MKTEYTLPSDASIMILDDDGPFRNRLGRAMEQRGFTVTTVETVTEAKAIVNSQPPAFAVLDMRLEDGNGL
ncbi:MAG: response regulator, partial [Maricaulaceae bacterium]